MKIGSNCKCKDSFFGTLCEFNCNSFCKKEKCMFKKVIKYYIRVKCFVDQCTIQILLIILKLQNKF